MTRKLVVIESPYAGDIDANVAYARACLRDSLLRGESPIASHLLYTQEGVLNDLIPEERKHGIDAGLEWLNVANRHVFYVDRGISSGMRYALKRVHHGVSFRSLVDAPEDFVLARSTITDFEFLRVNQMENLIHGWTDLKHATKMKGCIAAAYCALFDANGLSTLIMDHADATSEDITY